MRIVLYLQTRNIHIIMEPVQSFLGNIHFAALAYFKAHISTEYLSIWRYSKSKVLRFHCHYCHFHAMYLVVYFWCNGFAFEIYFITAQHPSDKNVGVKHLYHCSALGWMVNNDRNVLILVLYEAKSGILGLHHSGKPHHHIYLVWQSRFTMKNMVFWFAKLCIF
jgi:hypothetical protein